MSNNVCVTERTHLELDFLDVGRHVLVGGVGLNVDLPLVGVTVGLPFLGEQRRH